VQASECSSLQRGDDSYIAPIGPTLFRRRSGVICRRLNGCFGRWGKYLYADRDVARQPRTDGGRRAVEHATLDR